MVVGTACRAPTIRSTMVIMGIYYLFRWFHDSTNSGANLNICNIGDVTPKPRRGGSQTALSCNSPQSN